VMLGIDYNNDALNHVLSAADESIRDPQTPEQRAYNFFIQEVKTSPSKVGYVSAYAEAWEKENVVDYGKRITLVRADGTMFDHSFANAHRAVNENYAEIKSNLDARGGLRVGHTSKANLWKVQAASKALYAKAREILETLKGEGHG